MESNNQFQTFQAVFDSSAANQARKGKQQTSKQVAIGQNTSKKTHFNAIISHKTKVKVIQNNIAQYHNWRALTVDTYCVIHANDAKEQ